MSSAGSTDSCSRPTRRPPAPKPRRCNAPRRRRWPARSRRAPRNSSQAPNEQIVLAADGTIRWIGEAVGKLAAGDDALRPRVRIVADEHLTGAARETVQARLDLWLKTHIEKLLGAVVRARRPPKTSPAWRAASRSSLSRRSACSNGRRSPKRSRASISRARATLRKYGVRFGAYHIYLPALLKPAPRALAAQLWALKHEAPDSQGPRRAAAPGRQRPHLDPGRQGHAEGAVSHRRLSRVRRARGARRHSGTACRSDPPGAGLARRRAGRRSRAARSTAAASPSSAR